VHRPHTGWNFHLLDLPAPFSEGHAYLTKKLVTSPAPNGYTLQRLEGMAMRMKDIHWMGPFCLMMDGFGNQLLLVLD